MDRLNEREVKQVLFNAQVCSYPSQDVPVILKSIYQYIEDVEAEIRELKQVNDHHKDLIKQGRIVEVIKCEDCKYSEPYKGNFVKCVTMNTLKRKDGYCNRSVSMVEMEYLAKLEEKDVKR